MKILALNATYQPKKTTTQLVSQALAGAAAIGAQTEMVLLRECRIEYCQNCLKCYRDKEAEIGPCTISDDMDPILEKIRAADGILLASPVHNGFVTGLMTVFFERMAWRVMRSTGSLFGALMGLESRLTDKIRAVGAIVSAGGIPPRMRKHCDDATPWLKGNAPLMLHGQWVGDIYAGAKLAHMPRNEADWANIYFLRKLATDQRRDAYDLGIRMASAIEEKQLRATTVETLFGPVGAGFIKLVNKFRPNYTTAE